ncbi:MAG: APC family permease [Caulobacteraceae bacterium]
MILEADEGLAGDASRALLRVLGIAFSLAVVVGGVIGSGILRAPGVVAEGLKTAPLIIAAWAAVGLVTAIAAMPIVEAGASVRKAGGPYPIAARAFGPGFALFTGWICWIQYGASQAFISVVFGEYAHRLGLATGVSINVLACLVIVATAAINWTGTRVSGGSQTAASALKGLAFLALAIVLFLAPRHGPAHPLPTAAPALGAIGAIGAVVMAITVIYQTYAGWDTVIYFSEEVHRPERAIASGTFGGVALVAFLYVAVNAAALHVLTPAQMAGSKLAVGDAARIAIGPAADTVITALSLFSLAAIVNLQMMTGARITWRMAADGVLPSPLARVSRSGSPRVSIALLTLLSLAIASVGGYESIVRFYAPWSMAGILIVCLAAIALRWREPGLERPWKMPLFPLPAVLAAAIQIGLIAFVIIGDPKIGLLSALVAIVPPALWWAVRRPRPTRPA